MRQPTTSAQRWKWWEAALAGEAVQYTEDDPQCGFFKVRKFPYGAWTQGPWLPARVWMEPQDIDPVTGELLSDEIIRMTINGKEVNPWKRWTWIARKPITETEWKWLRAMSPLTPDTIPKNRQKQSA